MTFIIEVLLEIRAPGSPICNVLVVIHVQLDSQFIFQKITGNFTVAIKFNCAVRKYWCKSAPTAKNYPMLEKQIIAAAVYILFLE